MMSRFLGSVVDSAPKGVSVIVADNGSTDNSVEWLEQHYAGRVEIVRLDRNYGFAEGYNRALAALQADYFILLNSDVECPRGWCEPLIDYLEQNPSVAAVGPKILSATQRDYFEYAGAAGGFIDRYGYPFCRGRILSTVERDRGQYDNQREVFWVSGACMAVRAEAFRAAGGFDGDFFAHMEEIDLCWRLQLQGWRIVVCPSSWVYHLGGGTLPASSPQKAYYNFRNSLFMLHKELSDKRFGRIIRTRMALDRLSAMVYRLSGRPEFAESVRRAHRDYRAAIAQLDIKRQAIRTSAKKEPETIFRGSILLRYVVRRRFGSLKI